MRKEFIVAICCLTVGACIVFSIGVWGALRKSEVVKPASVEDTEVSEEILPEPVKEDTEVVMSDVETSEYLEEYISEMESESVERAEGISRDFGDSVSIYTISDIPVDSEEDYMYMSDALGSDLQTIAGRYDPPLYIHAIACYFKEDMVNVRSITSSVQGLNLCNTDVVPSSALYFSDGNKVLAVWLDSLYVYSYDCTQEIINQLGDITNLMPQ